MTKTPFFLLGNPRSGTSLFRLMMNNNPHVVVPPECGFSEWLFEKFNVSEINHKVYDSFAYAVLATKKFETWGVCLEDIRYELDITKPKDYESMVSAVYQAYARKSGKVSPIFGDKNNYYINKIEKINVMFPGSQKIFIVRDGRDVACSYMELSNKKIESKYRPNLSGDISSIAKEWRDTSRIIKRVSREECVLTVKYEDLVQRAEEVLSEVCQYLGVPYSNKMLQYYKNNDEPEEFLAWKEKTAHPIASSSIGRYVTNLSQEQVEKFEEIARDELKYFGYTLSAR